MPTPFGVMRMSPKSELSYGALFLVVSLVARSVALAAPVGLLRDAVGVFSVVMLVGGVIVVIVGLWHAARRADHAPPAPRDAALGAPTGDPGWFPDQVDSSLLRFWNGHAWTGDTARRKTSPSSVASENLVLGAGLGIVVGIVTGGGYGLGLWIALGAGLGVTLGAAWDALHNRR
jgi:hypothetical protein